MELDPEVLKQLAVIFQAELGEQAQVMIDGLLLLEKQPQQTNNEVITTIFRAAHNIKGAARGIGAQEVGDIAHRIETLFSLIQKKSLVVTSPLIDLCLDAVDKMRLATQAFIEHKDLSFDLQGLLAALDQKAILDTMYDIQNKPAAKQEMIEQKMEIEEGGENYESIRVALDKIDKVFSLMEEIQVNKISIEDYVISLNELNTKIKNYALKSKKDMNVLKAHVEKDYQEYIDKLQHLSQDFFGDLHYSSSHLEKNMRSRLNELSILTNSLQEEVRLLRLVPAASLLHILPRYVRDLSRSLNKNVEITIHGDEVKMDKLILESLKDPLMHIIRNAMDHGIETESTRLSLGKSPVGHIAIDVKEDANEIVITVSDDGAGIDLNQIASLAKSKHPAAAANIASMNEGQVLDFIFLPGFSTKEIITDVSGRGVGLDVVKTNLNKIKGSVNVVTKMGHGTAFNLRVPLTLSSERGMLVKAESQCFILTTHSIQRVLMLNPADIIEVEGNQAVLLDGNPIPFRVLANILNINQAKSLSHEVLPIVIAKNSWFSVAFLVDEIMGEREMVIKPLRAPLSSVPCLMGGSLLERNQVAMVIDTNELINRALHTEVIKHRTYQDEGKTVRVVPHILVVDDSITTRTLEKNILEGKDYKVSVAVNGKEAWELLQQHKYSLLITDISMPIMDGFTLTDKVKKNEKLHDLPVIIVTSLGSDAEKARGIEVGADAYIVKTEFESGELLNIVTQLV